MMLLSKNKGFWLVLWSCFFWLSLPGSGAASTPLSSSQAFQLIGVNTSQKNWITSSWTVQPLYYLYQEQFQFKVLYPAQIKLGKLQFPTTSITKRYPTGKKMKVYTGSFDIKLPIINNSNYTGPVKMSVQYQGCSELGVCYPTQAVTVGLNLSGNSAAEISKPTYAILDLPNGDSKKTAPPSEQNKMLHLLKGSGIFTIVMAFFGGGILLSLTPCVLPMIPIVSSIIVGQKKITHWHSFLLTLVYVLTMSVTYAILGLIAGSIGSEMRAAFQTPWVITLVSFIFVVMALSLFEFYNLQLPNSLSSKIAGLNPSSNRSALGRSAIMGCLSTLILSPCLTPPLASAIIFIGDKGNGILGAAALFSMGVGMGIPLLIIGAFGTKLLPKTGSWMKQIKHVLGVLMLGVAIGMLSRVIPGQYSMALWAFLAIGCAIGMKAFHSTTNKKQHTVKCAGIALFIYGLMLLFGAFQGKTNPLKPLALFDTQQKSNTLSFEPVTSVENLKTTLLAARHSHKPVIIDFFADWCIACHQMDANTFNNPQVKKLLKPYKRLRADITRYHASSKALQQYLNVIAPPTLIFFDSDGTEIKNSRVIGEVSAQQFIKHLKQITQHVTER